MGEPEAELIHAAQAVRMAGGTIDYFVHTPFNVPTYSASYKDAAVDGSARLNPGAPLRAMLPAPGSTT